MIKSISYVAIAGMFLLGAAPQVWAQGAGNAVNNGRGHAGNLTQQMEQYNAGSSSHRSAAERVGQQQAHEGRNGGAEQHANQQNGNTRNSAYLTERMNKYGQREEGWVGKRAQARGSEANKPTEASRNSNYLTERLKGYSEGVNCSHANNAKCSEGQGGSASANAENKNANGNVGSGSSGAPNHTNSSGGNK